MVDSVTTECTVIADYGLQQVMVDTVRPMHSFTADDASKQVMVDKVSKIYTVQYTVEYSTV